MNKQETCVRCQRQLVGAVEVSEARVGGINVVMQETPDRNLIATGSAATGRFAKIAALRLIPATAIRVISNTASSRICRISSSNKTPKHKTQKP